jgi:CRP-like cAMP-binding protein
MRGSVGRGVKERKHSMKPVSLSHTLAVPGFEEASLHPAAVAGAAAATASFGSTLEEAGTTSVRPALAQLDTSTNPFGDGGGGIEGDEVRMLSPTSAAAAGEEGGSSPTADEASGADGAGGFLSMRAMQMTPGKRAWSAARDRASKALADATDDYGLSDPAATIHLLLPGAVFGLSREAAVQREQEAAAARVEVPRARRRWRRLAESVRVQKGLLSSYHAAELEVEGKQPNNTNGPAATPTARAHAAQARSRRPNLTTAVGRLRAETMLSASDDTLLITLAQSEHDRVMQSNLDRHRFKQVQALQCMAIFQQPAVQQQQQAAQGVKPVPTKASKRAAVLSPWKIKHLVQLLPWLTPVSFPPHAVIAEEDQLCHTLWLVVSGAVTLWKDVELRVHTRLPAAPGEAQTVMESRKYRRVHVATRGRGDALAEEAVLGAPKLDFTLKAGGGGVELFAIQRRHFLPFFRPARLAILRTRVAAARSSAVNYLNATASDLLPGTSLGLVRSADEEGGGDDEAAAMFAPKQHHIVVNMLEAIADDLRGEEDAGRNRSGSGGVKRRVQKSSSGSLSSTASAAAAIAAVAAESNALPPSVVPGSRVPLASFKADPQASRVWVSPQATPAGAGGVGAGATAVPGSTPLSPVTIAKGPGLHVSASTGSLVLLGQTEHRPHSPAKYQTAVRLPAHIVTPLPAKPALSLQASSAAARRIIFDLPEEGHEASGSASPSPSDESGSTSSSKLGGNLLWNSALFARDGATAASSSSSSARVTATSSTAALLPDMLLNNRVQLNENDVARIRQQQQHAAAALALQQQHQAQAQREAAAARAARLASPVRRVRIVNPGSPPPSTPGSPQMVAMSAGTPVEPLSPASLPPVAAVPPTPVTASAAVITNVLLSRTETTADQPTHNGSAASQLHVFFAMFTV